MHPGLCLTRGTAPDARVCSQCDKEMAELRARNTSLAESLLKAPRASADGSSSEAPSAPPQEKGGAEAQQHGPVSNGHGDAAGGAASPGASKPAASKGSGEAIAAAEVSPCSSPQVPFRSLYEAILDALRRLPASII